MTKQKLTRLWWVLILLLVITGFGLLYLRVTKGLAVTNLNNIVGWGLWVALYIFFIGISAGSYLVSATVYGLGNPRFNDVARLSLFISIISLVAGLFFIFIDIGHMSRFWTVFFNHNWASVLSWELQLYVVYFLLLIIQFWLVIKRDLHLIWAEKISSGGMVASLLFKGQSPAAKETQQEQKWVRRLALIGIPLSIAVHGGTGAIFAVVKARSFWNSAIFPIVFLVSALLSGIALILLVSVSIPEIRHQNKLISALGKIVVVTVVLDFFLFLTQMFVIVYDELPRQMITLDILTSGSFSNIFWVGQVGLGLVVPLLIFSIRSTRESFLWNGVGGLLALVGVFIVRLNLIIPPLSVPVLGGLVEAYNSSRVIDAYFPSMFEIVTSLVIIIFSVTLFNLGLRYLPLIQRNSGN